MQADLVGLNYENHIQQNNINETGEEKLTGQQLKPIKRVLLLR